MLKHCPAKIYSCMKFNHFKAALGLHSIHIQQSNRHRPLLKYTQTKKISTSLTSVAVALCSAMSTDCTSSTTARGVSFTTAASTTHTCTPSWYSVSHRRMYTSSIQLTHVSLKSLNQSISRRLLGPNFYFTTYHKFMVRHVVRYS